MMRGSNWGLAPKQTSYWGPAPKPPEFTWQNEGGQA